MPQRSGNGSGLMRPFVVLALPGMYLLYKYNQYRQQQMETARRRVTERELLHLNTKIKPLIFPAPFRRVKCPEKPVCKEIMVPQPPCPLDPQPTVIALPEARPGVQVAILGADTAIGQYLALLLKQCPVIKKLRLYEARDTRCPNAKRELCNIVEDLRHIDTNCLVQAFSCACFELERCLQNSDVVIILESGNLNMGMSLESRFLSQAPLVKTYADSIATECPNAVIIVCASPIECMVPLVAETMKETGWHDPGKIIGSMAVQEMRASTLASKALCLEPVYTRVPCIGGTEGDTLVPLFSRAIEHFDFATHNAMMMTDAVRTAPRAIAAVGREAGELSEAHAIAGLTSNVARALLCIDRPKISGYVETDPSHVISPARFIANAIELNGHGICKNHGLPKMRELEVKLLDIAIRELESRLSYALEWHSKFVQLSDRPDTWKDQFSHPNRMSRFDDCAYANVR